MHKLLWTRNEKWPLHYFTLLKNIQGKLRGPKSCVITEDMRQNTEKDARKQKLKNQTYIWYLKKLIWQGLVFPISGFFIAVTIHYVFAAITGIPEGLVQVSSLYPVSFILSIDKILEEIKGSPILTRLSFHYAHSARIQWTGIGSFKYHNIQDILLE